MISCTRRLEFDAAHRVPRHESKCRSLHGHRYAVEITCIAPELDEAGRVIDFGVIKERVGEWIDDQLDHTTILQEGVDDDLADTIDEMLAGRPVYRMAKSPTAENIAEVIYIAARNLIPVEIGIVQVRVHETPNCWADFIPDHNDEEE
jgi:6-pyruvoyltetrahydropterin/6-carboxytetrahydropterin synthase